MNINLAIYTALGFAILFFSIQNTSLKAKNQDFQAQKIELEKSNKSLNLAVIQLQSDYQKGLESLNSVANQKEVVTKVITKEKIITKQKEDNESVPVVIFDTSSFILDRLREGSISNADNQGKNTK
ncbi:hypothetical protein CIG2463D_0976 [Campylobacter iguaniorum]|uniref:hypothetical protein n=1 Tax=Campylobacter iguaniorum TaxID=1244531 RepID=UPI00073A1875|nr:hypothetical protein [Campylobacter iguaniorum]ALV24549.1 hypothetical protein CIG2463D_0976 [Campylobacter iguaniorum]